MENATAAAIDVTILLLKQPAKIVLETDSFSKACAYSFVQVDSMQSMKQTNVKFVTQGASLVQATLPIAPNALT